MLCPRTGGENVNGEASGPDGRAASRRARITPLASDRTASARPYFRARGGHADQRPCRPAESCAMTRCQPTHPVRTRPPRPSGRSWSPADYQEDPDASRPGWAAAASCPVGSSHASASVRPCCRGIDHVGPPGSAGPHLPCRPARARRQDDRATAGAREPVGIIQDIAIRDAEGIHTTRKS
jgi:hypothetical protein